MPFSGPITPVEGGARESALRVPGVSLPVGLNRAQEIMRRGYGNGHEQRWRYGLSDGTLQDLLEVPCGCFLGVAGSVRVALARCTPRMQVFPVHLSLAGFPSNA